MTTSETTATEPGAVKPEPTDPARAPRQFTIRWSTVARTLLVIVLIGATAGFAILYLGARHDVATRDARAAEDKRAEQLATDYAVGAATIDYHDTKTWFDKLKTDTTPQLAAKFDAAQPQLEQILLPLQWTSKATPIAATVTSRAGDAIHVSTFLTVNSTSVQTPQGGLTTVAYTITIDPRADWKITEVGGGLDGALPGK